MEYGIWNMEHGTWNTDYYINIMYTIDTMVKHRSAKRATKRSAKRAAKRGAYKSKKTHRKMKLSRKRMQRGGGGLLRRWQPDFLLRVPTSLLVHS